MLHILCCFLFTWCNCSAKVCSIVLLVFTSKSMDDSELTEELKKLQDKTWPSWIEFEKDLKIFESNTATAHRLDRSDLVTTSNRKRERLGQTPLSTDLKYTRAVFVCCHYGEAQSKATGQRKCRR